MIIILEGVDGSGKTTLCKQLKDIGYTPIQIESGENEFLQWQKEKLRFKDSVAICDRSFITDLAYRIYDCESRRGMDLMSMCKILENDVKIVFLESNTEYEDSMSRGEDNVTTEHQSRCIKRNYRIIADVLNIFTNVKTMFYNWRNDSISDVINFIKEE